MKLLFRRLALAIYLFASVQALQRGGSGSGSESESGRIEECAGSLGTRATGDTPPAFFPLKKRVPSATGLFKRGRKKRWDAEEEGRLIELREQQGLTWQEIDAHFPDRGWRSLEAKYRRLTQDLSEPVGTRTAYRRWTADEDDLLRQLGATGDLSWKEVAQSFPGRTALAVGTRYGVLTKGKPAPAGLTTRFTAAEDELLLKLSEDEDMTWAQRAEFFDNRSARALEDRYARVRPPRTPTWYKTSAWTEEEYEELEEALDAGMTWKEISELLERTEVAVIGRVGVLVRSGRLARPSQLARYDRFTDADFELMRTKRDEGIIWKDIVAQYFPHRTVDSAYQQYQTYERRKAEEKGK